MVTQNLNAPTSGAIHVRTRLTEDFTILANRLAQRPGSAATVGIGLFINSKPDGTPITIEALREHFDEGETVISRALRELEDEGWLARRLIRRPDGRLATRTYVYTLPELAHTQAPSPPARATGTAPQPRTAEATPQPASPAPPAPEPSPTPTPTPANAQQPPTATTPPTPAAIEILTALGSADPRLLLSRREIDRLGPSVDTWLTAGVKPTQITHALTTDLPDQIRTRPAHLLSWRLSELMPAPAPAPPAAPPPLQNCPDCDHGFHSPSPGRCPTCETAHQHEITDDQAAPNPESTYGQADTSPSRRRRSRPQSPRQPAPPSEARQRITARLTESTSRR